MEACRQTPKVDIGLISRQNQAGPIGRVDHEVLGSNPFPCFIDFEASSLEHNSYPIEVAWSDADGRIESWLMDPSGVSSWTDWDDRIEAELHGLSQETLRLLGCSPSWVARRLNEACAGQALYCDGGPFDHYWLYRLFQAAGVRPAFKLADAGDLFERYLAPESLTALAKKARSLVGYRHRAAPDVHYQQVLWRLILTESEEMHGAAKKRVSDGGTASEASSHAMDGHWQATQPGHATVPIEAPVQDSSLPRRLYLCLSGVDG